MNITLAAASFTLIAALSSVTTAHATGFNDQSMMLDIAASVSTGPQDLRHIAVVQGFNQQSYPVVATRSLTDHVGQAVTTGTHCDLAPRFGFQDSTSFSHC